MNIKNKNYIAICVIYLLTQLFLVPYLSTYLSKQITLNIYLISTSLIGISILYIMRQPLKEDIKSIKTNKINLLYLLLVFVGMFILYPLLSFNSKTSNEQGILILQNNSIGIYHILFIINLVILVPIVEETIFQYGIQRFLEDRISHLSKLLSIIITTFLFIIVHGFPSLELSSYIPYIILIGYGFFYNLSGKNLFLTIVLHTIWNSFPYFLYFIIKTIY